MNNQQKRKLVQVIKSLTEEQIAGKSVSTLWKEHGSQFTYSTFKNYFEAFAIPPDEGQE